MSTSRSPITTHILDLTTGKPAAGVRVSLEKNVKENQWTAIASGKTNADGRIEDLLTPGSKAEAGVYRINFETGAYFKGNSFYPYATIIFEVKNPNEHHHVPLLLSPHGLSTYRGS